MGIAAGLIWNEINSKEKEVKQGLKFFVIQLALNALWSYLFFGLQNVFLAALEVILLLLMIYETYLKFKPIHKNASYLLLPYVAWVSFASVLTWSIWFLNR